MGFGGGGGSTTTQHVDMGPWEDQQPFLRFGFDQARDLYDSGMPAYYPGATVAPFSPETADALRLQRERALAGSPLTEAAQGMLAGTIRGDGLAAGNPYLQGAMDAVAHQVVPRVAAQFEGSGRYGSGLHAGATAQALTDAAADMAYRNYADERARQLQAAQAAPQLAAADYADIAQLGQVGAMRDQQAQAVLDAGVKRWDAEQAAGWDRLAKYMAAIGGNYGQSGTTTETTRTRTNPFMAGLGALGQVVGIGTGLFGSNGLWPGLLGSRK